MKDIVKGYLKAVTSSGGQNFDEFKVLPSVKCKVVGFERKYGYYKITLEEL